MQLDRFIQRNSLMSRRQTRQLIVCGRVTIDGMIIKDVQHQVSAFCRVQLDEQVLQAKVPYYLMLNKPAGVVSATAHPFHPTVISCISETFAPQLHLAGRLDFNTTGLILLTNDGRWSRNLTEPREKVAKTYLVRTEQALSYEYAERFAQGMHFGFEDIHLMPAELDIISSHCARLRIYEGRYHQVKRMFGYFNNKVLELHRESVGSIHLDPALRFGEYRSLSQAEIRSFAGRLYSA